MRYKDTWDLDAVFPGGSNSLQLKEKINSLYKQVEEFGNKLTQLEKTKDTTQLQQIIKMDEQISKGLGQAQTFITMIQSAFMDDEHASVVQGDITSLFVAFQKEKIRLKKLFAEWPEEAWQALLKREEFSSISFRLEEMRTEANRYLEPEVEAIIAEMNKDGISAWSELYDKIVSIMTIPFTDKDGNTTELSVGQAMNRMYADPNPEVREQLFVEWEKEWSHYGPVFAHALNHLAGSRLTLQKIAKRKHHLEEPLEINRMEEATLKAMWSAIEAKKEPFYRYLNRKAALFGMENLGWQDVDAPVTIGDVEPMTFTYEEACEFILTHFKTFGDQLTSFTEYALTNRWVEAEDRPNKRPGGYCASLPEFKESRIFMTFTGSASDVSTLAHELGHAFHSYVMRDLDFYNQSYAMNVAETASTFAELIIQNATIDAAQSDEEKISLLVAKLETATAMFLNIHARFLFEDAFYRERRKGIVSESRLNNLMEEAQRKAYGNQLSSYHPRFWSSKLHFFIESVPFYNFPYTFGYLFSLSLYAAFQENPEGFEEKYIALLRDTGSMKVEDLAAKHLQVDMRDEAFWTKGIDLMIADVEEFLHLTEAYLKK